MPGDGKAENLLLVLHFPSAFGAGAVGGISTALSFQLFVVAPPLRLTRGCARLAETRAPALATSLSASIRLDAWA